MSLSDILAPDGVLANVRASSKKQLFQELAAAAAEATGLPAQAVLDAVIEREKLGSTGVGSGVAIPHARLAGLDRVVGLFARLDQPIDFDAVDEKPADLIFLLLAPEEAEAERLKALARVSRTLRRPELREQLRAAPNRDSLRALLDGQPTSDAA